MPKDKFRMIKMLVKCGIKLNNNQLNKLWSYHTLIQSRNQEYGLTGIKNFDEIILKHYVDCFMVQKQINDISFPLLDIGTGAGFPGILLKILFSEEKIILAEPRKERVKFLEEAKNLLHLKNTFIIPQKITPNTEAKVKGAITRALEPIPKTLHRISGCLETGGTAIFMKGPSVDKEITLFKKSFGKEYRIIKNIDYTLPLINHKRRLVVLRREIK